MAIYEYECPNGHTVERLRPIAERNDPFPCKDCKMITPGEACTVASAVSVGPMLLGTFMRRKGIELQKRPRVIGGKLIHHRNEQRYTRGL